MPESGMRGRARASDGERQWTHSPGWSRELRRLLRYRTDYGVLSVLRAWARVQRSRNPVIILFKIALSTRQHLMEFGVPSGTMIVRTMRAQASTPIVSRGKLLEMCASCGNGLSAREEDSLRIGQYGSAGGNSRTQRKSRGLPVCYGGTKLLQE